MSKQISIIIAAKNESENIPKLIENLRKLNYPNNSFEVIIVDDNSTDSTFENAKELTKVLNNFNVISAKNKALDGKRGALNIGIEKSNYPFILITDADCIPQKNWLKAYSKKFDDGYDFSIGIAPLIQENFFVNKIACFDNLRTHILTFFFAKIGLPYSSAARNFGFKKESFKKILGYKNTTQTQSGDDDLLIREAVKNKLKVGLVEDEGSIVFSKAKKTLKEYFRQKARHTSTSNFYLLKHKSLLGTWHSINLLCLFSPALLFVSIFFLIPFLFKLFFDLLIVRFNQKRFSYKFSFWEIIYLQIFYELFLIVHYVYGSFGKPKWK